MISKVLTYFTKKGFIETSHNLGMGGTMLELVDKPINDFINNNHVVTRAGSDFTDLINDLIFLYDSEILVKYKRIAEINIVIYNTFYKYLDLRTESNSGIYGRMDEYLIEKFSEVLQKYDNLTLNDKNKSIQYIQEGFNAINPINEGWNIIDKYREDTVVVDYINNRMNSITTYNLNNFYLFVGALMKLFHSFTSSSTPTLTSYFYIQLGNNLNYNNIMNYQTDLTYMLNYNPKEGELFFILSKHNVLLGVLDYTHRKFNIEETRESGVEGVDNQIIITLYDLDTDDEFKIGRWLQTPKSLLNDHMRYMIIEIDYSECKIIAITFLEVLKMVTDPVIQNYLTGNPADWFSILITMDYDPGNFPSFPNGEYGRNWNIKRFLDFCEEWNYPYTPICDYDTQKISFINQPRRVQYVFIKRDILKIEKIEELDNNINTHAPIDSNLKTHIDVNETCEISPNTHYDNHGTYQNPSGDNLCFSSGWGRWCYNKDQGTFQDCPTTFDSMVYKKRIYFTNPISNRYKYVPFMNQSTIRHHPIVEFDYTDSTAPDLTDDDKIYDYYNKTLPNSRRDKIENMQDKLQDSFNENINLEVQVSLNTYLKTHKVDIKLGDTTILNISRDKYIIGIVKKIIADRDGVSLFVSNSARRFSQHDNFIPSQVFDEIDLMELL